MAGPVRPPSQITTTDAVPRPWPVLLVVFVVATPAILSVLLATKGFEHYGAGLFVLVPLCTGIVSSWLYNRGRQWSWLRTFWVVMLTMIVVGWGMVAFRIEGIYCVLMAAGLGGIISILGIGIAWLIRLLKKRQRTTLLLICGLAPLTMGLEWEFKPQAPMIEQTTSIEINATPDVVWRFIPAFPPIQTPAKGMLGFGLAYPVSAEMDGTGVGAKRRCVLSTDAMPEIITVWEPGQRLEFEVLATPAAMLETNLFGKTEAAHTNGYFTAKHGRFVLTALPGGRTRVEGTSWFQHDLWPQSYWAPITRRVVKEIHLRVLDHVRSLAEHEVQPL